MSEEKKDEGQESMGLMAKLLETRTIVISDAVKSELAAKIINQILIMEKDDAESPITVIINSPGGEVYSGFAIYDMLQFVGCPIHTIVTGFAASMGSILSLAASPGKRFATPNSKIMIHQPMLMGYQGRATDCEIQATEILKTRDKIIDLYCKATGHSYEDIKSAIDRDKWFSAEEAVAFNLLDRVVQRRSDIS